jgi:hypothetical protein
MSTGTAQEGGCDCMKEKPPADLRAMPSSTVAAVMTRPIIRRKTST